MPGQDMHYIILLDISQRAIHLCVLIMQQTRHRCCTSGRVRTTQNSWCWLDRPGLSRCVFSWWHELLLGLCLDCLADGCKPCECLSSADSVTPERETNTTTAYSVSGSPSHDSGICILSRKMGTTLHPPQFTALPGSRSIVWTSCSSTGFPVTRLERTNASKSGTALGS